MLSWSVFFPIIALVAALLGFSGIGGAAAGVAKMLFGYSWSCSSSRSYWDGELSKTS